MGFSTFLFEKMRPQIWGVIIWAKNDNFSHFAKHRLIKKTLLLQPPFSPKIDFFKLFVLKPKTFMLNKKHNLKSGKNKDKEKGFERKNKTGNHKKEKKLMKQ